MNKLRKIIDTLADLARLNSMEVIEGYLDGRETNAMKPGDNRSDSYYHGWNNGEADRLSGASPWQMRLAREYVKSTRKGKEVK